MPSPYLQHLVTDPTFGYLFPHRLAIAAFGVANEYQLRKHLPQLTDGVHYTKIRGNDNIQRLFYSLSGLLALADLINSPQAQDFWKSLVEYTKSGGALVHLQPAALYTDSETALEPIAQSAELAIAEPPLVESAPFIQVTPDNPAYALAQYLSPEIQRIINNALTTAPTSPIATPTANTHNLTPQDTATLIFKAQEVLGDQIAKAQASQPKTTITVWQQCDGWLSNQDGIAISILYATVVLILGFSSYLLTGMAIGRDSYPTPQPQVQTLWK